jgi:hypothetical protein
LSFKLEESRAELHGAQPVGAEADRLL